MVARVLIVVNTYCGGFGYKFEHRRRDAQLAAHPSRWLSADSHIAARFSSQRESSS